MGDFTDLCLMGKSSRHISDSDSDVSDDSSPEGLSLRVAEPENALCNQDKLLGMVFHENKRLCGNTKKSSEQIILYYSQAPPESQGEILLRRVDL
jgi:hypothetical protein